MVVKESAAADPTRLDPTRLDLGYVGFFLGLRINELVSARLAAEGFGEVRESHGYVIQHLIEEERSITELARRMEVSQQAASKAIAELVRLGVVEAIVSKDRRTKRIRLSNRGWRSIRFVRKVRSQIERRLIRAVGASQYDETRTILLQCFDELGGIGRIRSRRIRAAN
jgi:DNA-binding MarR family transcriptional regulator